LASSFANSLPPFMFGNLSDYLFNYRPLSFAVWGYPFLASAILALIYWAIVRFYIKRLDIVYRGPARKLKTLAFYYGFISLIFYFVRYERIPYLSMRFLLWLWIVGYGLLTFLILYLEFKKIPNKRAQMIEREKKKRYLEF